MSDPSTPALEHRARPIAIALALIAALIAALAPSLPAHAASSITPAAVSVEVGATLTVAYETDAPHVKNWIGIYRVADGTPDGDPAARVYAYAPATSGSVALAIDAARFAPGDYLIHFLAEDGYAPLADPVALRVDEAGSTPEPPAEPSIVLSATTLQQGQTLDVDYAIATAGALNWIGIYRAVDGAPDGDPGSRDWEYAPSTSGRLSFTLDAGTFAPGDYLVYFLANDGYAQLSAPQPFTVSPEDASVTTIVDQARTQDARVGDAFEFLGTSLFWTTGGVAADVSIVSGPSWLTITDGVIGGTPTAAGEVSVVLEATVDGASAQATAVIPVVATGAALGDDLRVMTYNAWHQGGQVADGRLKELRAFLSAGADVVALQESSTAHATALAEQLGWTFYSSGNDSTIISRYPLADGRAGTAATGVLVVVDEAAGREVWVWSAHLGYTRYGPYYAQEGRSVDYILSEENVQRGPQMRANLAAIAEIAALHPTTPVIVAGDYNTPSHLDWIEANRADHGGLIVPWPVTVDLESAGFIDTFRVVNPDPIADPATSWTPRFLDEPQDRIDFIHARGDALDIVDSEYLVGGGMDDWASDHGAFVTGFRWADAEEAINELTISTDRASIGDPIEIDYAVATPAPLNWVAIYRAGDTPGTQDALAWQYVADAAGSLTWDGTEAGGWTVQGAVAPGDYQVSLFADDGYDVLAGPREFTLVAPPRPESPPETGESVPLRVMTWNIYHGGLDDNSDDEANRQEVAEAIKAKQPDVLLAIETYGAADTILTELNDNASGVVYTGTRITSRSDDNLWIFTNLPIVETLPAPSGAGISDFNIGGIVVRLANNREVALFDVWSTYTDPWIGYLIEENAEDVEAGLAPRNPAADIIAADRVQTEMVAAFIEYADRFAADEGALSVLGGDLNTVVASDWSVANASCPSHFGLSYELTATPQFDDAGFVDAFRDANPDACAEPGVTWGPREGMATPDRIDVTYVRGDRVEVLAAQTFDTRLAEHGGGAFYSDHAGVIVDLLVGSGELVPEPAPGGSLITTGSTGVSPWVIVAAMLVTALGLGLVVRMRRRRNG
jgi:endonuclease/exonuclease/phosphatase family metal-dependent hydrolase